MRGFKESKERTQTPLGAQSKRFDLLQQRANLTDTSLSAMKQRDETVTPVERIQFHNERSKIDTRQLVQKTRMDRDRDLFDAHGPGGCRPVKSVTDRYYDQESGTYKQGQGDQAGSSEGQISPEEKKRIEDTMVSLGSNTIRWHDRQLYQCIKENGIRTKKQAEAALDCLKNHIFPNKGKLIDALKQIMDEN